MPFDLPRKSPSPFLESNIAWQESLSVLRMWSKKKSQLANQTLTNNSQNLGNTSSDKFIKNWATEGFQKLATHGHLQPILVENGKLLLSGFDPDLSHQLIFNSGQGVLGHTLLTLMPLHGRNSFRSPTPKGGFTSMQHLHSRITLLRHNNALQSREETTWVPNLQSHRPHVCTKG